MRKARRPRQREAREAGAATARRPIAREVQGDLMGQTTDPKNVEAALAQADRMATGADPDRSYNPWFLALAAAYREQQTENERLRTVLGAAEGNVDELLAIGDKLGALAKRLVELERLIEEFIAGDLPFVPGSLEIDGRTYTLLTDSGARKLRTFFALFKDALEP